MGKMVLLLVHCLCGWQVVLLVWKNQRVSDKELYLLMMVSFELTINCVASSMKWPWLLNSRMPADCQAGMERGKVIHHYCFLHGRSHIHPVVEWAIDFFEIPKKNPSIGLNVYLANCKLHPLHSCIPLYPQNDAESILGSYCANAMISEIVSPLLCTWNNLGRI